MRASPRATPTTIPATVPLASRLQGDGVGVTVFVGLVGLLLVKVLGLVLLGMWAIGVEVSLAVMEGPLTEGLGLVDAGGLVGPLFTLEDTKLEAEVGKFVLPPEAAIAGTVREPPGSKYVNGLTAVEVPTELYKVVEIGTRTG